MITKKNIVHTLRDMYDVEIMTFQLTVSKSKVHQPDAYSEAKTNYKGCKI